ncbi:AAA family ATPase [Agrobacterium fabrum]|uniref:AAA family ATPase n=1 Tax=Agrobacterium fabrum TaxID=1176649 RepID=UPI0021589895|nr:helicase RepA family protein [Agrobacterium fabrum]MCR6722799.1 helicase RepA family protein [Agrobacterium fabrum]
MAIKEQTEDRALEAAIRMYQRVAEGRGGKLTKAHMALLRDNPCDSVDIDHAEAIFQNPPRKTGREASNDNDGDKPRREYEKPVLGAHYDPRTNPAPVRMTMRELMSSTFNPREYIVDELLPVGCIILVGAPKVGKSWFVYQLARCIDAGRKFLGRDVKQGRVIYFALEDGMERLQHRALMQKLDGCDEFSDDLVLQIELEKANQGGMDELRRFLQDNADTKLVIIDVLKMFRSDRKGKSNAYDDDYADIKPIQALAREFGCCIIIVHHTNKGNEKAVDPFDRISGTGGIAGAADGTILLVPDGERRMGIYGRGRDFREFDLPLSFNADDCIWEIDTSDRDAPDDSNYGDVTKSILKALERENGNPITPTLLGHMIGVERKIVSVKLGILEKSGKAVKADRGQWVIGR